MTDTSDAGVDPRSTNPGDPADQGTAVDITPAALADIGAAKEVVATTAASSGTVGNIDVELSYVVQNTGSEPLTTVSLTDDLVTQLGATFVGVVDGPDVTAPGTANAGFDGAADTELLGGAVELFPSERITVTVTVEIDPKRSGLTGSPHQPGDRVGHRSRRQHCERHHRLR